ncbi:hypothetical protein CsSME_00025642 [Camellia sinensis var. sinensis]
MDDISWTSNIALFTSLQDLYGFRVNEIFNTQLEITKKNTANCYLGTAQNFEPVTAVRFWFLCFITMEDGEIDFSNQEVCSSPNIGELPKTSSWESFLNDFQRETCTHTHICNPPRLDSSHSHTCRHVHTKIVPAATQDKVSTGDIAECLEKKSNRCPTGNREAVRKYREKKKARTASLEDEVVGLKAVIQQLMKRLQGQAALEAEVARLKCLLVDIRGRIDGEIGSFPYHNPSKNADMCQNLANPNMSCVYVINPCDVQCDDQVYCFQQGVERKSGEDVSMNGQGFGGCDFENLQCLRNQNAGPKEFPGCGL